MAVGRREQTVERATSLQLLRDKRTTRREEDFQHIEAVAAFRRRPEFIVPEIRPERSAPFQKFTVPDATPRSERGSPVSGGV